jgi:hypothetical protein
LEVAETIPQSHPGRQQPPKRSTVLTAGNLEAVLEGGDLAFVRFRGRELLRRIGFALRGPGWSTVPSRVTSARVSCRAGAFDVAVEARNEFDGGSLERSSSISGRADGCLAVSFSGRCRQQFAYYRLGLYVLHPLNASLGARARLWTRGEEIDDVVPLDIDPKVYGADGLDHVRLPAFRRLRLEVPDDWYVDLSFEGDLFELEDQRNYGDASLKTYGTPLTLPLERLARTGECFAQSVTVRCWASGRTTGRRSLRRSPARIEVSGRTVGRACSVGLAHPFASTHSSMADLLLLRAARPAHLRVDVPLDLAADDTLANGVAAARALACPLELAVFLTAQGIVRLDDIRAKLDALPVARVLAYCSDIVTTPPDLVRGVREAFGEDVVVGGGTYWDFAEINALRPQAGVLDVLTWRITPQVHAFDEASIMQTPPVFGEMARAAAGFAGGAKLAVGPLTLKPHASLPGTAGGAREGDEGDTRQPTLFCAAWTVAVLAHLAIAGVDSVTCHETHGERGVLTGSDPLSFASCMDVPAAVAFPVYHIVADWCEWSGADVLECRVNSETVASVWLADAADCMGLLANLSPEARSVEVVLPRGLRPHRRRRLSPASVVAAMQHPYEFRTGESHPHGESLALQLEGYEIVRLDVHGAAHSSIMTSTRRRHETVLPVEDEAGRRGR